MAFDRTREPSIAAESEEAKSSVNVANAMISMHARCGCLQRAKNIFRSMQEEQRADLVSWNAIIGAHAEAGHLAEALDLYRGMLVEGMKADEITMVLCLEACDCSLVWGKTLHRHAEAAGFHLDTMVCTAVITMYGRCGGCLNEAKMVFDRLLERGNGDGDVVLWTAMLGVYIKEEQHMRDGIGLFRRMDLEGVTANETTMSSVLDACSALQDLDTGKMLHKEMASSGNMSSVVLGTALLDMYAKCGELEAAKQVFDEMKLKNTVTWNAMVAAYAAAEDSTETTTCDDALSLCREMELQGIRPDKSSLVTFLTICSHRGLVETGLEYMSRLPGDYGFDPTPLHSACVVDLLSRVGSLDEAHAACTAAAGLNGGDVSGWLALLSACRSHDDAVRGAFAAARMLAANPLHSSSYVLLSTIYSTAACVDDELP